MVELEDVFKKLCTDGRIKQSEVHALLKLADKDKSGTITFDVSTSMIIENRIDIYTYNKSNMVIILLKLITISYIKEFHILWDQLKAYGDHLSEEEQLIREEFDKLDTDNSGFITKAEMLASISNCDFLGGDKTEEARKCLEDIDVNGDGKVSYPEFLMVWKFKY